MADMDVDRIFSPFDSMLCLTGLQVFGTKRGRNVRRLQQLAFCVLEAFCFIFNASQMTTATMLEGLSFYLMDHVFAILFIMRQAKIQEQIKSFVRESSPLLSLDQKKKLRRTSIILTTMAGIQVLILLVDGVHLIMTGDLMFRIYIAVGCVVIFNPWFMLSVGQIALLVLIIRETEKSFFARDFTDVSLRSILVQRLKMRQRQRLVSELFGVIPFLWFAFLFFLASGTVIYAMQSYTRYLESLVTIPYHVLLWGVLLFLVHAVQSCTSVVEGESADLIAKLIRTRDNVWDILREVRAEMQHEVRFHVWHMFNMDRCLILSFVSAVVGYLTLILGFWQTASASSQASGGNITVPGNRTT